ILRGEVTGAREDWPVHAALWTRGKVRDLGTLGGLRSRPRGIDSLGRVVGGSQTAAGQNHGFLYASGRMRDIGTLHADPSSVAIGINRNGWIVGTSWSDARSLACIWIHYRPIPLSSCVKLPPGWTLTRASAINSQGWILADAERGDKLVPCLLQPR